MINKTQILKGILEGCVLSIINDSKCYSGDLVFILKDYGFTDISSGTIFPLLLRLEKDGLVSTYKVPNELGPMRKYYQLTEKGKLELEIFSNMWQETKNIVNKIIKIDF